MLTVTEPSLPAAVDSTVSTLEPAEHAQRRSQTSAAGNTAFMPPVTVTAPDRFHTGASPGQPLNGMRVRCSCEHARVTDRYVIANELDGIRGRFAFTFAMSVIFGIGFIALGFESEESAWVRFWLVVVGDTVGLLVGWLVSDSGRRELGGRREDGRVSRWTLMSFAVAGTGAVGAVLSFEATFLIGLGLSWFSSVLAGSSVACYRRLAKNSTF